MNDQVDNVNLIPAQGGEGFCHGDLTITADPKADKVLSNLSQAGRLLAEAHTLSETKDIMDAAASAEEYIKRQQLGEEAECYARSLKLAAEIKLGEILLRTPKADGGDAQRTRFQKGTESPPTLSDLRIGKKLSSEAQKLARLDEVTKQAVIAGEIRPVEALRQAGKAGGIKRAMALPEGKYRVLYADPPWRYRDTRGMAGYNRSAAEDNYPTMSMEELRTRGFDRLAADDSVLFLWVTDPLLPEGLEIFGAWGFEYKQKFTWHKGAGAFGHYHDGSTETILLGTRGSCTPDADRRECALQVYPRGRHSEKPKEIREMIDRMYPHGPRIELFARGEVPGHWDVWGNEAVEVRAKSNGQQVTCEGEV